jgi:hypothetical protein
VAPGGELPCGTLWTSSPEGPARYALASPTRTWINREGHDPNHARPTRGETRTGGADWPSEATALADQCDHGRAPVWRLPPRLETFSSSARDGQRPQSYAGRVLRRSGPPTSRSPLICGSVWPSRSSNVHPWPGLGRPGASSSWVSGATRARGGRDHRPQARNVRSRVCPGLLAKVDAAR